VYGTQNHVVNLEFRELRWAIGVAQYRSVRQAAIALHVRPPTLSRRLRDLEGELGIVLFERNRRGTRPTEKGREFLEAAQRIVEEMEGVASWLKRRFQGEGGHLTIGVHASLSAGNLRATLIEHQKHFPDVETQLVDGSSMHLIAGLEGPAIDVAFVVGNHDLWEGKSLPVWSERVIAALPDGHSLSSQDRIHWSDLRNDLLILPEHGPGPEYFRLVISKLGDEYSCHVRWHDVALDRSLTLVSAGWGIALMLEGATGATFPGVVFREVHDVDGPTRLHFKACWRQTKTNPALRPFLDLLRERYPDFSGAAEVG
jgi:DNA-binding transcriptional LysR family regulator